MRDNRIRTALVLAGGFNQNAALAGDFDERIADWKRQAARPAVIIAERFENGRWVSQRQVWSEAAQRYEVAA
jgi:hypothetical protein